MNDVNMPEGSVNAAKLGNFLAALPPDATIPNKVALPALIYAIQELPEGDQTRVLRALETLIEKSDIDAYLKYLSEQS